MTYKNATDLSISREGVEFIKKYETFIPKAFWDYKQWSIGYGTKSFKGEVITEAVALDRLKAETERFQGYLRKHISVPLTQNMFDALTSFTFNVGQGWLINGSTVLKRLRSKDYSGAADGLLAWNRAGGKVLKGLVDRRDAERKLFLKDS